MSTIVCWDAALAIALGLLTGGLFAISSHIVARFRNRRGLVVAAPAALRIDLAATARPDRDEQGFSQNPEVRWPRRPLGPADGITR